MVFAKKVTKTPSVMVETKKLSGKDSCGMGGCAKVKHCLILLLLVINTLLLVRVLCNQVNVEANRVGGRWNYNMVQQIYKSPAFKAQQKTQIEQALQMYQQGWTQQPSALPTDTTTAPTTDAAAPVVTQ